MNDTSFGYDVSAMVTEANNGSSGGEMQMQPWEFYEKYAPNAVMVHKYFTPCVYVVGFPGNILALIVWLQKRMRNSSGYYLAALAFYELLFLLLQIIYELNEWWNIKLLNVPFWCEAFPVLFLTVQFLSPLLVLAFTVERYISICHPFKREKYCTTKRAKMVIISLSVLSLCMNGIQGYFWNYEEKQGCSIRNEVLKNGQASFWSIWTWSVESIVFFLVPLAILVFNILVIVEARRLSKFETVVLQGRPQRNSATTAMLLAVSFYQIFTTLPITIVVALFQSFPVGDDKDLNPPNDVWQRHFNYFLIKTIVEEIGLTHYACNFYIYLITGKVFRQELKRIWSWLVCKKMKEALPNWTTEYTSLRGSVRHNTKAATAVRIANGHANGQSSSVNGTAPSETTL